MGAVGAAVAGGVASAAVGTVGSALVGGKASGGSGQAQQILGQQRNDLMPWVTTGGTANTASADLLGLNGPDAATAAMGRYQTSPGYEWQFNEGRRAVESGAAANEMTRSGAAMKALDTFGQGLANTDFGQYYQRLAGLSTLGENAAAGGAQTAGTGAQLAQGAGNTQASIYGNLAGGIGSTVNGLFQNSAVQKQVGGWFSGDAVSPSTVSNNALYQQGAFAAQPPGTYGPFF